MTEFRPDCTINLHLEKRGQPAKVSWSCSILHEKHGRLVQARKFIGQPARDEAELTALLFGLKQAARFLQEKVEVRATFPVDDKLPKGNSSSREPEPGLKLDVAKAWGSFRLRRVARMDPKEAEILRREAEKAFAKK